MSYIHRKGIKYLGTEIGANANTYIFTYKGNNYIKYKPISDAVEYYDSASGNTNINTLSPNIEYYLGLYKPGTSKPYGLTLSHIPDMDNVFAWISEKDFNAGFNMPAATIHFHPNARLSYETIIQKSQEPLDPDTYFTINPIEVEEGPMTLPLVSTLFNNPGYMGNKENAWRLNDVKAGQGFKQNSAVNLHENYSLIYPETKFYFYAQWEEDTVTKYLIHYIKDIDKPNIEYATQEFTYSVTTPIILNRFETKDSETGAAIPGGKLSKTGYVFKGWVLNLNDTRTYPDYYPGSDFMPRYTQDVYMYGIWEAEKAAITYYDYTGGRHGLGAQIPRTALDTIPNIPKPSDVSFYKNTTPVRLGYSFDGWITQTDINSSLSDHIYWPGDAVNSYAQAGDKYRFARWVKNSAIPINTTSNVQAVKISHQSPGHLIAYTIQPKTNVTMRFQYTGNTGGNLGADASAQGRIVNSVGEWMPIYDSSHNIKYSSTIESKKKNTNSEIRFVDLVANQVYYFESLASGKTDLTLSIKFTDLEGSVTIDPTSGFFYQNATSSTKISASYVRSFDPTESYVGISTTDSTIATNSYISEPTKDGYQFREWIGNPVEPAYIRPRTLNGQSIHATYYCPLYDFSVSAKWDNNIHYVKYNGNTSTLGYMSDSEHYYDIESNLWANQYEKFAYINYDLRYGAFTDVEQQNEVLLTHDFIGWDESATRTDNPQYSDNDNFIVDDKNYGTTTSLYAQWQLNHIILPEAYREGFIFMGWHTEADGGDYIGAAGDEYITEEDITLYAHWDPIGLVNVQVDGEWKYAIPYIYTNGEWKRALMQVYSASKWEMGTNLGQNMTNQQLEDL